MDIQSGMQLTMPSTHGLILRPDLGKKHLVRMNMRLVPQKYSAVIPHHMLSSFLLYPLISILYPYAVIRMGCRIFIQH